MKSVDLCLNLRQFKNLFFFVNPTVTFYDQALVLEAFVLTVAATVALTMYTMQSKRDYSSWGAGYVCVFMLQDTCKLSSNSFSFHCFQYSNTRFTHE